MIGAGSKISNNAIWVALAQFSVLAIQMVTLLTLSQFLDVKTFGAFAIAIALVNFVNLFKDLGTSTTLIKKENLKYHDIDSAHTINFVGSCIAGLIILFSSMLIDRLYRNEDLTVSVILIAISIPFSSLGLAKSALLQRKSKFKSIAIIEIAAAAVSSLFAIATAALGLGIYALVMQLIVSVIISTTAYLYAPYEYQPKICRDISHSINIFKLGSHITGFNIIHYITRNGDVFLIGKIFGEYWLGLYVMGMRLAMLPYQLITAIINKALLPVLSENQNNSIVIAQYFIIISRVVINLSSASVSILVIFKSELILNFLGLKWRNLEYVIAPLAYSGLIFSVSGISNIYLIITNNTYKLILIGLIQMIFTIGAILISIYYGFYTLLYILLACNLVVGLASIMLSCEKLNIKFSFYLKGIATRVIYAIIFCFTVAILKYNISKFYNWNYIDIIMIAAFSVTAIWILVINPLLKDYSNLGPIK